VFTPTSVGPRDVGKERYTCTAVGVTATEDGLRNGSKLPEESVRIEDVESFFAEPRPVGCLAKGPLTDGENHTASLTDANSGDFYVSVHVDDTFYRRDYRSGSDGDRTARITVHYEPASARTVLQDVRVGPDEYDPPQQCRECYSSTTVVRGTLALWHGSYPWERRGKARVDGRSRAGRTETHALPRAGDYAPRTRRRRKQLCHTIPLVTTHVIVTGGRGATGHTTPDEAATDSDAERTIAEDDGRSVERLAAGQGLRDARDRRTR